MITWDKARIAILRAHVGSGLRTDEIAVAMGTSVASVRLAMTRNRLRALISASDREACLRLRQAGYASPQIGMRVGLLPAQVERILAEATTPA